jgi:hypothetical protein
MRCDETFCTHIDLVCPTAESCGAIPGWELDEEIIARACGWQLSLAVLLPRTCSDSFWPARLCELVVLYAFDRAESIDRSDLMDAFDRKVTDLVILFLSFGLSGCWFGELCSTLHAKIHKMKTKSTAKKATATPTARLLLFADVAVSMRVRFDCSGLP